MDAHTHTRARPESTMATFTITHDIDTAADGAPTVFAIDVDGDGDVDVLSASAMVNHLSALHSAVHNFLVEFPAPRGRVARMATGYHLPSHANGSKQLTVPWGGDGCAVPPS